MFVISLIDLYNILCTYVELNHYTIYVVYGFNQFHPFRIFVFIGSWNHKGSSRKVQAGLQASYFQLLSHTLLLIPIEHAPSNQINEVMTLNPDHNTNYKLSYVVTTGGTSSCFLVEFFPWKKNLPLYLTIPTCQLAFTAARVSSKGSSL